jgi:segregation and condensation protein B
MSTNPTPVKAVIEAALLCAGEPLNIERLQSLFDEDERPAPDEIRGVLEELAGEWEERPLELKQVGSGYRFQARQVLAPWLGRLSEERAPRYSRALLETLALIVYRQPITRAGIEEIRGVTVSSQIIRTLLEREWIRVVGHRDVPGKPALFGTTKKFLDYFNLKSLGELPPLADIQPLDHLQEELGFPHEEAAQHEAASGEPRERAAANAALPADVPDGVDEDEYEDGDIRQEAREPAQALH